VSVLSLIIALPLAVAAVLALTPRLPDAVARGVWLATTLVELAVVIGLGLAYEAPPVGALAFEEQVAWIPGVGTSYHVGLDGLSLPLVALTAVLFAACAVYALHERRRPRTQAALFLFLQSTCLGLFAAADLIVFFVFFDLSIVGMFFAIAGWGHGNANRSALVFFLYTFLGSLALLLGFIGLYVASQPHTFDMVVLAQDPPLEASPVAGGFVLAAVLLGLAVKTPTVPFHTWLPPAPTDAPAIGSAVLAGVLLKMGTYGFVRIAMPMLPEAWREWAWVIITVGVVSVLYGALVALAQTDVKRMIAYTSVNHMGYVVLAVGAAGLVADSDAEARSVAVTGAVTQMVSHGLITGALFLLAGVLHERAGTYDMGSYGGLASPAPRFATLFAVGAFASLGLPGFSGFIAEFQVFAGSIAAAPVTAVALLGILITAALFLRAVQRLLTGPVRGRSERFTDLRATEAWAVAPLLALALVIGVVPRPLLEVIEPAADAVVAALDLAALPGR
jgi:NADH-quinone oxidoreductase subunit M